MGTSGPGDRSTHTPHIHTPCLAAQIRRPTVRALAEPSLWLSVVALLVDVCGLCFDIALLSCCRLAALLSPCCLQRSTGVLSEGVYTPGSAASEAELAAYLTSLPSGTAVAGALVGDTYTDWSQSNATLRAALAGIGVSLPSLGTAGGTAWSFLGRVGAAKAAERLAPGYSLGGKCFFGADGPRLPSCLAAAHVYVL
jgi:hypothetical protein